MATEDNAGFVSLSVQEQKPAVDICRAVYGGSLVLRTLPAYLPQLEKENDGAYLTRLITAVAIGSYRKTVRSLKAIVFSKPITLGDDVPVQIRGDAEGKGGIAENIDLAGRHLNLFAQDQFLAKLIDGHALILVDWHGPEGARSSSSEKEARARPYWTLIQKGQVARPYVRRDDGALVLESFAYFETDTVRKGAFAEEEIKRCRQFDLVDAGMEPFPADVPLPPVASRRVLFRSWTQRDGGEWEPEETGRLLGDRMTRIPVVVDYSDRTGFMASDPPALDVALEVVKHWQVRSDRDRNLQTTSIPVFCLYGLKEEDVRAVTIANSIGLLFPGGRTEQGAEFAEAQGHGLAHSREELQDIEKRIAEMGLSSLQRQSRAAETAQAHQQDEKAQNSELASWAVGTKDAIEEALGLTAMWMGLPDGGSAEVNTNFEDMVMDPAQAAVYLKAVGEGNLSVDGMWDAWIAGKWLPEDFDKDLEKERIQDSGNAELAAVAEALRRAKAEQQVEPEPNADGTNDATDTTE